MRDKSAERQTEVRGPIGWMASNPVASSILMAMLLIGGVVIAMNIKQEVFPEFSIDIITVRVAYPGASPEEVEQGIVMPVEEAVRDIEGIDEITSVAAENAGTTNIKFTDGTDMSRALSDVKSAVDALSTLPEDSERPSIAEVVHKRNLMDVVVHGDLDEYGMRSLADQLRDELLQIGPVTTVNLTGVRPREVGVEVPQAKLQEYGLTLDDVARAIRSHASDVSGGGIDTAGGEVLVRVQERKDIGSQFARVPVLVSADGSTVRLDDVAAIVDGFSEDDIESRFNGKRAVLLGVYADESATPVEAADEVKAFIDRRMASLPPGVELKVFNNRADVFRERLDLLLNNAYIGLIIVVVVLGLFLDIKLAFWVTMGLPVSFLGAVFLIDWFGASINMVSMMAFIMALGMLVDDAIVVGENVYQYRQRGYPFLKAAIAGTREVALPVTFAIITNIVAFFPLLYIEGIMGRIFWVVPTVVISAFVVSLVEALFILPAHLAHSKATSGGLLGGIARRQQRLSEAVERVIKRAYAPVADFALRNRYVVTAAAVAMLLVVGGYVGSNRIKMLFMEGGEENEARAAIELRYGAPVQETREVAAHIEAMVVPAIASVIEKKGLVDSDPGRWVEGVFRLVGMSEHRHFDGGSSSHEARVTVYLMASVDGEERPFQPSEFTEVWRAMSGEVAGAQSIVFSVKEVGPGGGDAVNVALVHTDSQVLEAAARDLASELKNYPQAKDIDDGLALGKPQLDFRLTAAAAEAGLTAQDIGTRLRSAFHGAEAKRFQRGRDEVKVMVRLPRAERRTELSIDEMLVRTPAGTHVPLREVAHVTHGHAFTTIDHLDGKRIVRVTADVYPRSQATSVSNAVIAGPVARLKDKYPGLAHIVSGRAQEMSKSMASLVGGFVIAIVAIFGLLAVLFRSYIQPLIIMVAIPFGIIGAVIGHVIFGFNLSLMSMMGIVALSGIVVNDSLVMIDVTNTNRLSGQNAYEAVKNAGLKRLRPILLTTFTTFLGLMPMLLETSPHIRMLQPMAISLGFGVLFSTMILLLMVPSLYAITEDVKGLMAAGSPGKASGDAGNVPALATEGRPGGISHADCPGGNKPGGRQEEAG